MREDAMAGQSGRFLKGIATLGFVGYLPKAPGTFGTLAALIALLVIRPSAAAHVAILVLVLIIGTVASASAERSLGRKDSSHIVVDEFAGYLVATAFVPHTLGYLIAAFVLFRLLDIFKPPPIKVFEGLSGGLGVMADDVAAGLMANVALQVWRILF